MPDGRAVIGEAPCRVPPDGFVLAVNGATGQRAIFDPAFDAWRHGPARLNGAETALRQRHVTIRLPVPIRTEARK